MAFIFYNPNPANSTVGDCVVRAISKATGQDWDKTYLEVGLQGYLLKDMPTANHVWGSYLYSKGFQRYNIPESCPGCYTIRDFCRDYPNGLYLLATGNHVVAVRDGDYYDTWDSGGEIPIYYWKKEA